MIRMGSISSRASSLRRRLTRFRATAECLNRGMTSPIRGPGQVLSERARGEAAARTSMCMVRMRFPSRAMRWSSPPRVIRASRGKPSDTLGVLRSRVLIRDTNRELLPSLFAATSKRSTTPFCFHTRTKTVRLEPPCVTRPVGWLSHLTTPSAV
jgi:hypothetical protein